MKSPFSNLAFCIGLVAGTSITPVSGASLSGDWLASPNQSNTASDTWQYFKDISGVETGGTRSGSYTHLTTYTANYPAPGLESWAEGSTVQIVGKNTSGATAGIGLPANQVFVHPGHDINNAGVGVGYLIPATGFYNVAGSVQPYDNGAVNWFLDANAVNLASGDTSDGLRDDFSLNNVQLTAGDLVYLIIGSRDGYAFDTTGIDLVIRPAASAVPDGGQFTPALAAFFLFGMAGFFGSNRRVTSRGELS